MDIVLTASVGFILILSQGSQQVRGDFRLGDGQKNYTDAVTACRDNDSQLVLPLSHEHNKQIREYANKQSKYIIWIDLQIFSTGWNAHHTRMMLYNQGCYNISYLEFTDESNSSTLMGCHDFCNIKSAKYAAFQELHQNDGHCICPHHVQVNVTISESECDRGCWMGPKKSCESYSVVAVNGSQNVPAWDSSQPQPQPSILCAAYYEKPNDRMQFLTRRNCLELLPSLCSTTSGTVIQHTSMTWFEAHTNCTSKGGYLLSHDFNQSQTPDWINNRWYWTGLTAWMWRSNTVIDPIVYTNWGGGQPNLTRGSCVFMRDSGMWESSSCDDQRGYICDSGGHPTSASTANTLSESTTHIATGTANPTTSSSSSGTTRVTTDPTPVASTDYIHVSGESTVSNDTHVITTTSVLRETDSFTYVTSPSERQSTGQFDVPGVKVGVPIALIAIIAGIVLSIVIYRRRLPTKTPAILFDNPTYDQANDDIIGGKIPDTLHNYERVTISRGETSTDHEVNLDHLDVTDASHVVRATPNIGITTEGFLIVDNDLYSEVSNERNDEPAADKEIAPVTDEGVFIVENHLYGEQLINSKPEQANIGREGNSGNSRALTSEGAVRPPLQNAAVYEDAELVLTEKLHGI